MRADYKAKGKELPKRIADGLEREAKFYRLVSSQGFFVPSDSRLVNPMADSADEGVDTVASEALKIKTVKALMERGEGQALICGRAAVRSGSVADREPVECETVRAQTG